MQRIQAVPERLIGIRIEVAVAVQGEANRGMPSPGGDLLRIRPGRNPQRHRRMPQVMDAQPIQPGHPGRRTPDSMPEGGQPQRPTLRTHKHQIVGGPGTGQQVGQGLDHDPGEPDPPIASSGLGRPEMQITMSTAASPEQ
jgi:hypothetical protein